MWHICTVEYYEAITKNEVIKFAGKWMELQIMLRWVTITVEQEHKERGIERQEDKNKKKTIKEQKGDYEEG